MSRAPIWLHIDINSYFATMLQQEVPSLRGKPLGILKEAGRSCIIAASNEAKLFGIKTGCSLSEARQKCPQLISLPAPFEQCLSATKQLRRLFYQLSPDTEIFSLDEAFIYFTPLSQQYDSPQVFAQHIQQQIKQQLGEWVQCNIGISHNRLLAKIASETAPKGSIFEITEENMAAVLALVPFGNVCGVGFRLEKKLKQLGVTVPYQINLIDDETLEVQCGLYWARELRKIGKGEEPELLARPRFKPGMKSISRSITGYQPLTNKQQIKRVLYNLSVEVLYKSRQLSLAGRQPSVALYGSNGEFWSSHKTVSHHIRHLQEFFEIIYHQLYRSDLPEFAVIKFAVCLSLLEPWQQLTDSLLPSWQQREKVAAAVDKLTEKYGLFAVRSGLLHKKKEIIMPEVTGFLGDQAFQFRHEELVQ